MNPSSERSPERLISEQDWVRPLVQRLVRDEASAQDVLQSARLRALRSPPRADVDSLSWRSWFARVARNIALRQGERDGARREREARVARGESIPSTLEIVEREEQRAKIVAHVLALPEPYKTTLVLRFYEGLEPRAIARAQSTNASTVRNRIARGLALLRERLERERGKEWVSACLAVLPLGSAKLLVAHAGWTSWIAKGAIVVKKIEVAAAAALLLTAGAVWFAWPSGAGTDGLGRKSASDVALSKDDADLAQSPAGGAAGAALDIAEGEAGERTAAQQRKPAVDPALAAVATGVRVFGHVRDARGEPINQSGGTFTLQMGGEKALGDLPLLNFYAKTDPGGGEVVIESPPAPESSETAQLSAQAEFTETSVGVQDTPLNSGITLQLDLGEKSLDQAILSDAFSRALSRMVLRGSTRIILADAEGCQFSAGSGPESEYSVEGLHAGKWHAIVTHDNKLCRRQDFEIQPGEHQYQLDITLDDVLQVRVKLRTPDGRELIDAIKGDPELFYRVALTPVALRPGSAARFLTGEAGQDFGCGHYEPRGNLDEKRRAEIGQASGVLTITEAPPLEVGLAMSGQLIARRPLSPGQEEVDFTLSLEDLRREFATAVVRVVDAQTSAPIVGASVTIDGVSTLVETVPDAGTTDDVRREEEKRGAAPGPKTDRQGFVRIPWVLAGKHRLYAMAQGYSAFTGRVEIEAGGVCELKPVELTGHARISGRLVYASGGPAQLSFQLVPLDRFEETHESLAATVWSSNELGLFEIAEQRRERYVLRVVEGDSLLPPVVIDATQGDVGDLELRPLPAAQVHLVFTREPKEGAELRISTAAGLPALERDLSGLAPAEMALAPGSYVAEVREGAHRAGSVRFVVGKDALRVVLALD